MDGKIRVVVVDDSNFVRKFLSQALGRHADIEVIGQAVNGRDALDVIARLSPDAVTLDVEMPEMDGMEAIVEIRKRWPKLPVIMLSTLTAKGADTAIEALVRGATDVALKPGGATGPQEAIQKLEEQLLPKLYRYVGQIRLAESARARVEPPPKAAPPPVPPPQPARPAPPPVRPKSAPLLPPLARPAPPPVIKTPMRPSAFRNPFGPEIVVIGVSTGGPNALAELVPHLPGDLPVPVLIVQHMPPVFTKSLAERLDRLTPLTVREAEAGKVLGPGQIWIAPGDFHMEIETLEGRQRVIRLHQGPQENGCRPAVDVLFRSVAENVGERVLAVVLTGMGQDGLLGAQALVAKGARVIAQDEATSVVWGMPAAIVHAGIASKILPLSDIAPAIGIEFMGGER